MNLFIKKLLKMLRKIHDDDYRQMKKEINAFFFSTLIIEKQKR